MFVNVFHGVGVFGEPDSQTQVPELVALSVFWKNEN